MRPFRPLLVALFVSVGCHNGYWRPPVVIPAGMFLFRTPDSLCRGVTPRGHTFAAIIVRPDYSTGREDPAVPPGTIGVFEVNHFDDEKAILVYVFMREVIVNGRRVTVNGASAETDVTSISMPARSDTLESPVCLPAGSPFIGTFDKDVRARRMASPRIHADGTRIAP